ncbi:MFS transporter [Streptomyces rimosus]|uniref:MFS transporter n=1 Tax=Streptomyces rimosus TaxID=1927 RepID=UPI0004C4C98D|nr:MFS transporter [Streptomyces rimosus]
MGQSPQAPAGADGPRANGPEADGPAVDAPRPLMRMSIFRRLWAGDAVSRLGYQIALFLFPLLAVVELHSSGAEAGLVSASQFVPVVVLSIVAGVFADRAPTRTLIVVCTVVRGAALALLGVGYALFGLSLWMLLTIAFVVGSATVFYDIGYQSAVPKLLRPKELAEGNGILQASNSATQMAGPALAGVFVQLAGLPFAVTVTCALFAGAGLAFWSLRITEDEGAASARPGGRALLDGLRFTWTCRPIRNLCVQSGLFNLHEQAFLTAFMVYGVRQAGLSAGAVGLIIGVASIGALAGSVGTGRLAARLHAGRALTTGLLIASGSLLLGPLLAVAGALPPVAAYGLAFLCNGLALGAYNVYVMSLRQTIPPREYLGSVTASYRLVALGPNPLGALVGGALADALTPEKALLLIGASLTLSALPLLISPVKRVRRVEDAGEDLRAFVPAGPRPVSAEEREG